MKIAAWAGIFSVFLSTAFGQNFYRIDNVSENKWFFDEKIPGSLMNILEANVWKLHDLAPDNRSFYPLISQDDEFLPSLDTNFLIEFNEMQPLLFIHDSTMSYVLRAPIAYEQWIEALKNRDTIYTIPLGENSDDFRYSEGVVQEILELHRQDSLNFKKMWQNSEGKWAVEKGVKHFFSLRGTDRLILEEGVYNQGVVHFIQHRSTGDLCTYELDLAKFMDFVSKDYVQIPIKISKEKTKQWMKMAQQEQTNPQNRDYSLKKSKDFKGIEILSPERPKVKYPPFIFPEAMQYDSERVSGKVRSVVQETGDFLYIMDQDFEQWLPVKTQQTFQQWIDSALNVQHYYWDGDSVAKYWELGDWVMKLDYGDSSNYLELKRAWERANLGENLVKLPKTKHIWVEVEEPQLVLFGNFSHNVGKFLKRVVSIDTVFALDPSEDQAPYTLQYYDEHHQRLDTTFKDPQKYPEFSVDKILVWETKTPRSLQVMDFSFWNDNLSDQETEFFSEESTEITDHFKRWSKQLLSPPRMLLCYGIGTVINH